MTCSIDAIELPVQLYWPERYQDAGQAIAARRTIGGRNRTWTSARTSGRLITLEINHPWCWLLDDTATALYALAQLGLMHALTLDAESYRVRFRDPPLELTPLFPSRESGQTMTGATFWTGKINLIEV